jgi:hypothetical protein
MIFRLIAWRVIAESRGAGVKMNRKIRRPLCSNGL